MFHFIDFFFGFPPSEFNKIFEMQLTGATGGAIHRAQLIARITIAKSDSPNGVVRFINQSTITIPNPSSALRLTLFVERADGLLGDATIEKFGDPRGIVQFTEQDLIERIYSEPSDSEGPLKISLLICHLVARCAIYYLLNQIWDFVKPCQPYEGPY